MDTHKIYLFDRGTEKPRSNCYFELSHSGSIAAEPLFLTEKRRAHYQLPAAGLLRLLKPGGFQEGADTAAMALLDGDQSHDGHGSAAM